MPILMLAAAAAAATTAVPVDYRNPVNWLCRPGRADACAAPIDATVVAPNGRLTLERFRRAPAPSVDCFYVYPTISNDPTPNSDLNPGPEEKEVARTQFARFGSVCRTFAPMYRQVTQTALRTAMTGQPNGADTQVGIADVRAAFRDYLAHDNGGRPFVLVGHSQGSRMIQLLVAAEIEGKPIAARMLSAITPGSNLLVPVGRDVGGTYKSVPLCRHSGQYNCAVSYVTFRADAPPPDNSRFGRTKETGMAVACTNPAALAGGSASLDAYLGANGAGLSSLPAPPWTSNGGRVTTPFVKVPGLLSAQCVDDAHGSYLALSVHGNPADPRVDTIVGDVNVGGHVLADWGLHLVDVNAAQGNLVQIVRDQARAWAADNRRKRG